MNNVKNFPMVSLRCIRCIPINTIRKRWSMNHLQRGTASNWFGHLRPQKNATCVRWNASAAACKRLMWGCSSLLSSWTCRVFLLRTWKKVDVSHARIWTNQMEVWILNLDSQLGSWISAPWLGICVVFPLPGWHLQEYPRNRGGSVPSKE